MICTTSSDAELLQLIKHVDVEQIIWFKLRQDQVVEERQGCHRSVLLRHLLEEHVHIWLCVRVQLKNLNLVENNEQPR